MKRIFLFLIGVALQAQILSHVTAYWKFDEPTPNNFGITQLYFDSSGNGSYLTVNPINIKPALSSLPFRIGANSSGGQTVDGSLAQWGKWNRLLTAGEIAAIQAGQTYPFASTPTLLNQCADYYLLGEASNSATYADSCGDAPLTRHGTTTQVTGPGGSGHATSINGAYLENSPIESSLQTGNGNFTIAGWYNLAAKSSCGTCQQIFWGQVDITDSPATTGAVVYYEGEGDSIDADLGNGIDLFGNATVVLPSAQSSPTIGTWYNVIFSYNAVTSVMTIITTNSGTPSATFARNVQPGAVAGVINNAAHFQKNPTFVNGVSSGWDNSTGGPVTRATAPPNSNITFGNNSKTVWFWWKSDNTTTTQTIAGFYDFATNDIDWLAQISAGELFFLIGNNAGTFTDCDVAFSDTTSWHLFVGWYDKPATTLHLNVDHGAKTCSAMVSFTPAASTLNLYVGANQNGTQSPGVSGASQPFLGAIDEMGIANVAPTSADLDTLWNGGAGVTITNPSTSPSFRLNGHSSFTGFVIAQ